MALRDVIYNGLGLTPQSKEEDDALNAIMQRLGAASDSVKAGTGESMMPGMGMLVQDMPKQQFPDAKSASTAGWNPSLEPSARPENSDIPRDMTVPQTAPVVQQTAQSRQAQAQAGPPSEANPSRGGMQGLGQQSQASPQRGVPPVPQPDFWDRLGAFSRGYNTGGLVGAVADGMGSGLDRQVESQNLTANALVKLGVAPELVTAATRNPEIMKALVTSAFNKQMQPVEWKIDDIYDEKTGRKRRVMYNPRNPQQMFPIGGEAVGREQGLNPTEQKTLNAAEDALPNLDGTIEALEKAKLLNDKTFEGGLATERAKVGTFFKGGTWLADKVDDWGGLDRPTAEATSEWLSIMSPEAIKTMAATLTGATTNFELEEFKKVLSDPSAPKAQRMKTIDRMITLATRQRDLARRRVEEMRGGGVKIDQTPKPEAAPTPEPTAAPEKRRGVPETPPANARKDKKGDIYIPDPSKPGGWLRWVPEGGN